MPYVCSRSPPASRLLSRHDPALQLAVRRPDDALARAGGEVRRLAILRYDAATGIWYRLATSQEASSSVVRADSAGSGLFAAVLLPR
ncbi:MAG: hypothetical protein HY329_05680 [Chloroflexi bacterium]|nr:hypothetical protein [Chloroflexota bacterium]